MLAINNLTVHTFDSDTLCEVRKKKKKIYKQETKTSASDVFMLCRKIIVLTVRRSVIRD